MSMRDTKGFTYGLPIIVVLTLFTTPSGVLQIIAAGVAAIAAVIFIHLAAGLLWTPLLDRTGIWTSALILGCAILAEFMLAAAATRLLGDGFMLKLTSHAALAVLMFSWGLAAIRRAQDSATRSQAAMPGAVRQAERRRCRLWQR
jgi:hypothetical protein